MKSVSIFMIVSVAVVSCKNDSGKQNAEGVKLNSETSGIIKVKPIDSFYLNILIRSCDTVYGNRYSDENTIVRHLDPANELDNLLFESNLTCGAPMGSCGSEISVFAKTKSNYKRVFNTCGFNVELISDTGRNVMSFTYETRDGLVMKVYYKDAEFIENEISLNKIDYQHLRLIAEKTNKKMEDFTLVGSGNSGFGLEMHAIDLGKGQKGSVYLMKSEYDNCFIFKGKELVFFRNNIQSIEAIIGKPDTYSKLIAFSSDHYYQGIDTSYQIPLYFIFDEKSNKYVRSID